MRTSDYEIDRALDRSRMMTFWGVDLKERERTMLLILVMLIWIGQSKGRDGSLFGFAEAWTNLITTLLL